MERATMTHRTKPPMMVMPADNTGLVVGYLAGKYPKQIGHLYNVHSPTRKAHYDFMPFALDNGRFASFKNEEPWSETDFWKMVEWAQEKEKQPLWIVVPDVVGDAAATLREWDHWAPKLESLGWPLAMACQDGMRPTDVPPGVCAFLGGSTKWKRLNIWPFCRQCEWVHVGRINTERWLWECHRAGVRSVDGTGWFRGDKFQYRGLLRYLERSANGLDALQMELEFSDSLKHEHDNGFIYE